MFDERSEKWISAYKTIVLIIFWIFMALAVIGFFAGIAGELYLFDDGLVDAILGAVIPGGTGCVFLVSNMLLIQFLNNVQIIREKLESK